MPTLGGVLRFVGLVPVGFCIPIIACMAFAWVGATTSPLFGSDSSLDNILAGVVGAGILGFGLRFGWKAGRRGILLGMLLSSALIVLLIGSCFFSR